MNSNHAAVSRAARIPQAAIVAFAAALSLTTMTGCFGSPRATDTFAGAAIGAGGGALIGSAVGHPAAGALMGGVGGGALGYMVGSQTEDQYGYGGYGYNPYGYYPGGY